MKLSQILSKVKADFKIIGHSTISDSSKIEIKDIAIDSRLVKEDTVFFALPGKVTHGSKFIASAIANGASIIVSDIDKDWGGVTIVTKSPFKLLIEFLNIFYSPLPSNIYAVTGTNGKTSTVEFMRQILQFLGKKSASIGTLGIICDNEVKPYLVDSSLTTPDIVSLYKNLQILKKNQVNDVAIEVSSIGLEQGRISGIEVVVGAFTNFTQDHLDYHKSMEEYFCCKAILFNSVLKDGSFAVLNSDIPQFEKLKKICDEKSHHIIEYGFKARDLKIISILNNCIKLKFQEKDFQFKISASGEFQVFNVLCALGSVLARYKISPQELEDLLEKFPLLNLAPGRMQCVGVLQNQAKIFIDFAHSPDSLRNILKLARNFTNTRLVILFGCGGDRDPKKRPIMGKIANELADLIIITEDNPRTELPSLIRKEILAACDMKKTIEIEGRKLAIEKAISMLQADDILILAGKGHEKYQIIGDKKIEFDEEKIVEHALKQLS